MLVGLVLLNGMTDGIGLNDLMQAWAPSNNPRNPVENDGNLLKKACAELENARFLTLDEKKMFVEKLKKSYHRDLGYKTNMLFTTYTGGETNFGCMVTRCIVKQIECADLIDFDKLREIFYQWNASYDRSSFDDLSFDEKRFACLKVGEAAKANYVYDREGRLTFTHLDDIMCRYEAMVAPSPSGL